VTVGRLHLIVLWPVRVLIDPDDDNHDRLNS